VLNSSSLTVLPVTIFMYRLQQGAAEPTLVFVPILLATAASTFAGLLAVAWMQRLRLWDPVVLAWLGGIALALGSIVLLPARRPAAAVAAASWLAGGGGMVGGVRAIRAAGAWRRVPVYEQFVAGAKEGVGIARGLLPYRVAMLAAIGAMRASG